jgi:arylsulfatase
MWGKWHVGDVYDEHLPHNQGFDYAQYSPYNGAIWAWQDSANWARDYGGTAGKAPFFMDVPADYFERFGYEPHYVYEARAEEEPKKVMPANCENYQDIDDKRTDAIIKYVKEHAKSDKPFFVYFPSDATNAVCASPEKYRFAEHVDSANNMAVTLVQHDANMGRLLKRLEDLGIAENTLVIWYSDNGPMHGFFPSAGYSHFRGGKGDVTEGGVRVPALAWWPGRTRAGSGLVAGRDRAGAGTHRSPACQRRVHHAGAHRWRQGQDPERPGHRRSRPDGTSVEGRESFATRVHFPLQWS